MNFSYSEDSKGLRHGILSTRRGDVATPFFMPDATRACVRGLTNDQLRSVGVHPMVVNTYHLMLQPGPDFLMSNGGVHRLMNWDGPLLSDSGGFQVYSLIHKNPKLGKILPDGAKFRSVIDGSWHMLTPERAVQVQFALGTDMMVVLDDPRPPEAKRSVHEAAVERTIDWAARCKVEFEKQCEERNLTEKTRPLLFGVVQGGPYVDLREKCAASLIAIDFDGYGFGGRHIDEDGVFMQEIIEATATALPKDKPRFALGIGTPSDIVACYKAGWDMFDCVIPTREGRHGRAFVWYNRGSDLLTDAAFYKTQNVTNAQFSEDFTPLDDRCTCFTCTEHTRAYLRHLFRVADPLGTQLVALHNLQFYTDVLGGLAQSE